MGDGRPFEDLLVRGVNDLGIGKNSEGMLVCFWHVKGLGGGVAAEELGQFVAGHAREAFLGDFAAGGCGQFAQEFRAARGPTIFPSG